MNPKLEWQGCLLAAVLITVFVYLHGYAEKYDAKQAKIEAAYKDTPVYLRAKDRP